MEPRGINLVTKRRDKTGGLIVSHKLRHTASPGEISALPVLSCALMIFFYKNTTSYFFDSRFSLYGLCKNGIVRTAGVSGKEPEMMFEIRMGYQKHGDSPGTWRELTKTTITRRLDCQIEPERVRKDKILIGECS